MNHLRPVEFDDVISAASEKYLRAMMTDPAHCRWQAFKQVPALCHECGPALTAMVDYGHRLHASLLAAIELNGAPMVPMLAIVHFKHGAQMPVMVPYLENDDAEEHRRLMQNARMMLFHLIGQQPVVGIHTNLFGTSGSFTKAEGERLIQTPEALSEEIRRRGRPSMTSTLHVNVKGQTYEFTTLTTYKPAETGGPGVIEETKFAETTTLGLGEGMEHVLNGFSGMVMLD